jgi:hypothetical protein
MDMARHPHGAGVIDSENDAILCGRKKRGEKHEETGQPVLGQDEDLEAGCKKITL